MLRTDVCVWLHTWTQSVLITVEPHGHCQRFISGLTWKYWKCWVIITNEERLTSVLTADVMSLYRLYLTFELCLAARNGGWRYDRRVPTADRRLFSLKTVSYKRPSTSPFDPQHATRPVFSVDATQWKVFKGSIIILILILLLIIAVAAGRSESDVLKKLKACHDFFFSPPLSFFFILLSLRFSDGFCCCCRVKPAF